MTLSLSAGSGADAVDDDEPPTCSLSAAPESAGRGTLHEEEEDDEDIVFKVDAYSYSSYDRRRTQRDMLVI